MFYSIIRNAAGKLDPEREGGREQSLAILTTVHHQFPAEDPCIDNAGGTFAVEKWEPEKAIVKNKDLILTRTTAYSSSQLLWINKPSLFHAIFQKQTKGTLIKLVMKLSFITTNAGMN